jgi:hypothetical protein
MIVSENWNTLQAARAERNSEHFQGHITDVIGSLADPQRHQQAFLVEQGPNVTLQTHYHLQHQFQVVVAGSGTLGRHPLKPITVHYTTPESGYGPIVSGSEGLSYFTIREAGGRGAYFLPESRSQMRPGLPKSQTTSRRAEPLGTAELHTLVTPGIEVLVEPDKSGRAAWLMSVPAGHEVTPPPASTRGGRFHLVCSGSLETEGKTIERLGLLHLAPDENPWPGRAGKDGLQLLVLQFPAVLEEANS